MKIFLIAGIIAAALAGGCRNEVDCKCDGSYGPADCNCVEYQDLLELQREAQRNLSAIYTSQTAYYGEYSTYSHTFTGIGWGPEGQNYYAYFMDGDSIQSAVGGPFSAPFWAAPATSQFGFTIIAVSNIDCDLTVDVWSINDFHILSNVSDDVSQ